jgi:hypothetical protein
LLQHTGLYDDRLAADVGHRLKEVADVLKRARWEG